MGKVEDRLISYIDNLFEERHSYMTTYIKVIDYASIHDIELARALEILEVEWKKPAK